jgi:hypothetical protein
MKIVHINDTPLDKHLVWIVHKSSFERMRGKRNTKVVFEGKDPEDEQILLSLIREVDTLYINPKFIKTPELKNLVFRLNPEILL